MRMPVVPRPSQIACPSGSPGKSACRRDHSWSPGPKGRSARRQRHPWYPGPKGRSARRQYHPWLLGGPLDRRASRQRRIWFCAAWAPNRRRPNLAEVQSPLPLSMRTLRGKANAGARTAAEPAKSRARATNNNNAENNSAPWLSIAPPGTLDPRPLALNPSP